MNQKPQRDMAGYDRDYGARPLARVIQKELKDPLTDEVLFGRLARGGRVAVDAGEEGDSLVFSFPDEADDARQDDKKGAAPALS